jgi:hypothetical protein
MAGQRPLFLFFFYRDGLEVFGLEDLPAVETLDVIHPVSPGDDLGAVMLASDLHD